MSFTLPKLPYDYESLNPYMSAETLEFHHDKHHAAYVNNANKLIEGTIFEGQSIEDVIKNSYKENMAVFNNVAQHYNHLHFFNWMKKDGGGKKIPERLQKAIDKDLGGYDNFREQLLNAAVTQFGSGWAWLSVKDGKLEISKTKDGENPLIYGADPILGVDVWEHTYYIDYRNARPKFVEAFIDNLINWEYVEAMYEKV